MKNFTRTVYSIAAGALIFLSVPAHAIDLKSSFGYMAIICGSAALGCASKLAYDAHMKGKNIFNIFNIRIQRAYEMRQQAHGIATGGVDAARDQSEYLQNIHDNLRESENLDFPVDNIHSSYTGINDKMFQILKVQEKTKKDISGMSDRQGRNVAHFRGVVNGALFTVFRNSMYQHKKEMGKMKNISNDLKQISLQAQEAKNVLNNEKNIMERVSEESKMRQQFLTHANPMAKKLGTRSIKIN